MHLGLRELQEELDKLRLLLRGSEPVQAMLLLELLGLHGVQFIPQTSLVEA